MSNRMGRTKKQREQKQGMSLIKKFCKQCGVKWKEWASPFCADCKKKA